SADAGKGITHQHVDDARAAEGGAQHHDRLRLLSDLADDRRLLAERVGPQRGGGGVSLVGRDHGDELPLVGDVEGIDPQEVARTGDRRVDGKGVLVEHDVHPGGPRQLVGHRPYAAARRVAQPARRRRGREQGVDQLVQRCGVRAYVGLQRQVASLQHHGHAVVADGARHQHAVARLDVRRAEVPVRRDDADTGGGDVEPVGRAPVDHLGVAGDDRDARATGRVGHVGHDSLQLGDLEALLEHERGGQPRRPGAQHGQVVHRAVHRQVADRAAREAPGLDDERVGAERQLLARGEAEASGVAHLVEDLVGEGGREHGVDEGGRRLAAGTVGQGDDLVLEPRSPAPERLDAFQHLRLAVADLRHDGAPTWTCTARHSSNASTAWLSCVRCTLSERTTRQWSTVSDVANSPPSYPANPTVSRPRALASANATSTLREVPLVEMPSAMSWGAAWAMSWRENTTSKPMSLARAVRTAWSSTSERAGRATPWGGRLNKAATVSASVALPPLPKLN